MTELMDWDNLPVTEIRDRLVALQSACMEHEQVEVPVQEHFSDGCYSREVFIPKGTCLVGEIHLDEWITIVSRGKIQIASEEGVRVVDATKHPVTFISPAGVKRAGYALEDTWWTMVRATSCTTTEEVFDKHIVKDYQQLEDTKCLS